MAPKVLLCAIAAFFALAGCAMNPAYTKDSPWDCTKTVECQVPVNDWWGVFGLIVPEVVQVSTTKPMTLTWTLSGWIFTTFNPQFGIFFDRPAEAPFDCKISKDKDDRVYACTFTPPSPRPAGSQEYHYVIKTKGFLSPPDKDPSVVNN